jgi:hypothetical protein
MVLLPVQGRLLNNLCTKYAQHRYLRCFVVVTMFVCTLDMPELDMSGSADARSRSSSSRMMKKFANAPRNSGQRQRKNGAMITFAENKQIINKMQNYIFWYHQPFCCPFASRSTAMSTSFCDDVDAFVF